MQRIVLAEAGVRGRGGERSVRYEWCGSSTQGSQISFPSRTGSSSVLRGEGWGASCPAAAQQLGRGAVGNWLQVPALPHDSCFLVSFRQLMHLSRLQFLLLKTRELAVCTHEAVIGSWASLGL